MARHWRGMWLVIFGALLAVAGCGERKPVEGEYGYLLDGRDKDRIAVVDTETGTVFPVSFHEESDPEMLKALRNLRVGILYPQANGKSIFLLGELDAGEKTFKLSRWFITTPFYEMVMPKGGPTKTIRRRRLMAQDFYEAPDINMDTLVMDVRVHESRRYGGVGLPYAEKDFAE